jgi:tetratricopeptide (TPR) repeat protein
VALLDARLGGDHPQTITVLSTYGWSLVNLEQLDEAVPVLERAIARFERALGRDDLRIAAPLYSLAIARLRLRQLGDAQVAIERAIAIHHAKDPAEGRSVAQEYDLLGDILQTGGHPREGYLATARALEIKRKAIGESHEETGISYRRVAVLLLALDRVTEARAAIDRAVAIDEKARPKDHPELGWAALTLGDVERAERHPRAAVAAYERSVQILEAAYGPSYPALRQPLDRLADGLREAGELARAEGVAERAVGIAGRAAPGERELAQLRLAQVRWQRGADRAGALGEVRRLRAQLAALPFRVEQLPGIDAWLATTR